MLSNMAVKLSEGCFIIRAHQLVQPLLEKETPVRVPAYYSSNPTDPDVHHVHDDCPTGRQIPAHNRRQGTGGNRLCKDCRDM